MSLISLSKVNFSYSGKSIFRDISLSLERDNRIGLIGRNGCGKTTLLHLLTGKHTPDEGEIFISRSTKTAFLTQELNLNEHLTLYETVLESRQDFLKINQKLRVLELQLTNSNKTLLKKYENLQKQFAAIDGYKIEPQLKSVLTSLNFPKNRWDDKISSFSGGERTRIQLARILLQPKDILLMDEPTNHLDIKMIFWLEKFLKNLNIPYVIVSHDREFLNNTIESIIEIKAQKLNFYSGNYDFYKQEAKIRTEQHRRRLEKQQKYIRKTKAFIKKNIAGQKTKQAQSRRKKLAKMEKISNPYQQQNIKLDFTSEHRTGNDVFKISNLSIGFNHKVLAFGINLEIFYRDKIAILGKNGCGKTTFLQTITGEMKPISGQVKKGSRLKLAYYDQLHLNLNPEATVMHTIWALVPKAGREYVLSYLAKYGFRDDEVDKKVSQLSGGEKSRLYLAKLIHEKPNVLVLDEPTNHLDINIIKNLEQALKHYQGTLIFVSHDRKFIENIANKKFLFTDSTIKRTFKNIKEIFLRQPETRKKATSAKNRKSNPNKVNPLLIKKKKTTIKAREKILKKNENKIKQLEKKFTDTNIYNDEKKLLQITNRVKQLRKENKQLQLKLDKLETEYLEMIMKNES